jgi:hypothetical protein
MPFHATTTQILVSRNTPRQQGDAYIRDLSQSEWGNRAPTAAIGLGHDLTVAALLFTLGISGVAAELEYPWP